MRHVSADCARLSLLLHSFDLCLALSVGGSGSPRESGLLEVLDLLGVGAALALEHLSVLHLLPEGRVEAASHLLGLG